MAVPKRKTSHARTHKRKAQWLGAMKEPSVAVCSQCGEMIQTHRACPECGYYKGRKVAKVKGENEEISE